MIFGKFKDIVDSIFCNLINCKCFSRTSLSISKNCNDTVIEQTWQNIFQCILVHVLTILVLIKSVVEFKRCVLYIFCDSIYFEHRLMDSNFWIRSWNSVDFTILIFFIKKWSFTNINTNTHLIWRNMVKSWTYLTLLFFNQHIKIYISFVSSLSCIFFHSFVLS